MPLMQGKGPKSFEHNVKAELGAGKPRDQALAIAYSVKRKNQKACGGMVKYAKGGMVKPYGDMVSKLMEKRKMMAMGGEVEPNEAPEYASVNSNDYDFDDIDMPEYGSVYSDDNHNDEMVEEEMDEKKSRKGLLKKIFDDVHGRHYGE